MTLQLDSNWPRLHPQSISHFPIPGHLPFREMLPPGWAQATTAWRRPCSTYKRLSDRLALEAELGDSHPIGGSSCRNPCTSTNISGPSHSRVRRRRLFYGFGPSYLLYRGEHVQIAPVIELVGWTVLGGLETNCVAPVAQLRRPGSYERRRHQYREPKGGSARNGGRPQLFLYRLWASVDTRILVQGDRSSRISLLLLIGDEQLIVPKPYWSLKSTGVRRLLATKASAEHRLRQINQDS